MDVYEKLEELQEKALHDETMKQALLATRTEKEPIIAFCKKCGLPTTFEELGIAEVSDERLLEAAALSCAEDDTMGNMPFEVSAQDVFAAMKTADRFSRNLR